MKKKSIYIAEKLYLCSLIFQNKMTYQQTLQFMFDRLPMFHRVGKAAYKANLDNTTALDNYFGNPHKKFKTIHVAGTNGKGSVSHMLASVLQAAGYQTGLYTSPHLLDFRERIKINGKCIPEEEVTDFVNINLPLLEKINPSFFEMTVALAFGYFARQAVDAAVIEVGLGGRLDSTNIILPEVSVITNISFDHMDLLGDTLAKIAAEKAGIIKKNIPVVIGEANMETKPVFLEKAKQKTTEIYFADETYSVIQAHSGLFSQRFDIKKNEKKIFKNLSLDLAGAYQFKNIATVLCSLETLIEKGFKITDKNIYDGLKHAAQSTGLQGRWQVIGQDPLIICDTGHNPAGISYVVNQLKKVSYRNLHIIFGYVNDKDISPVLALLPQKATYYFTRASVPRALDENLLAEKAAEYSLQGTAHPAMQSAIESAKANSSANDLIFIGGSSFVVADALAYFKGNGN